MDTVELISRKMTTAYEIAFYKAGSRTGGYKVTTAQAAMDEFAGCVERYTAIGGFYIEDSTADNYTVVDLSAAEITIKLIGVIDDVMKATLKKKWDDLLNKRQ